jgi:hypothetical protein
VSGGANPALLATDAAYVSIFGGRVVYAQPEGAGNHLNVVALDPGTLHRQLLHSIGLTHDYGSLAGLSASGQWLSWILNGDKGHPDKLIALRPADGITQEVSAASPAQCMSNPNIGRDVVTWSSGACSPRPTVGSYLMKLDSGNVYVLGPDLGLYGTWDGGTLVGWQRSIGSSPFDVETVIGRLDG